MYATAPFLHNIFVTFCQVLGEGKFGIVLKASYVNGDAVVKLSKSPESLPIHEECKCHWQLSKTTTCVADLKGFVSETHDGRKTIRELFSILMHDDNC